VLPVENSSAGVVQEVSDLLWELPGLRVVREHVHPGAPLPASAGLGRWRRALPRTRRRWHSATRTCTRDSIRSVAYHDTAGAARARSRSSGSRAPRAIREQGGRGGVNGLYVLAEAIQDDSEKPDAFSWSSSGGEPARAEGREPGLQVLACVRHGRTGQEAFHRRWIAFARPRWSISRRPGQAGR